MPLAVAGLVFVAAHVIWWLVSFVAGGAADTIADGILFALVIGVPLALGWVAWYRTVTAAILLMALGALEFPVALFGASYADDDLFTGIVLGLTTVILVGGHRLMAFLGPSGSKVMMRLMGLIVMLIAVEFFFAGITPYVLKIAAAMG